MYNNKIWIEKYNIYEIVFYVIFKKELKNTNSSSTVSFWYDILFMTVFTLLFVLQIEPPKNLYFLNPEIISENLEEISSKPLATLVVVPQGLNTYQINNIVLQYDY